MPKTFRPALAVFAAVVLTGLAACGEQQSSTPAPSQPANPGAAPASPPPAPAAQAPAPAQAQTGSPSPAPATGSPDTPPQAAQAPAAPAGDPASAPQPVTTGDQTAAAQAPAPGAAAAVTNVAMPAGDATRGAQVFTQCKQCHTLEEGQNRIGPSLHRVVGRKAGTVPNFRYSNANKNSDLTWTPEQLFVYLENPRAVVPGTIMAFAGLKNPQQRADVIAYLQQEGGQ